MADDMTAEERVETPRGLDLGRRFRPVLPTRLVALVGLPLLVLLVAGAVAAAWWFVIRDSSPEPFSIGDAEETIAEWRDYDEDGPTPADGEIDGTWVVDPSFGADGSSDGTSAGYRIGRTLAGVEGEAVGRTRDVTGEVVVEGGVVVSAEFEVDLTTLDSGEMFRDNAMQGEGLETDKFPTAAFELTEPLDLPDTALDGGAQAYDATGDLTLHGVTSEVRVKLDASIHGDVIALVVRPVTIVLDDYGISKPRAPGLTIDDDGSFELQAFLTTD